MIRNFFFPATCTLIISFLFSFPIHASTEELSINDAYLQAIGTFANEYGSSTEFAIYDIDQDGTDDLIIGCGNSNADWMNYVFTLFDDNATIFSGKFESNVSLYKPVSGSGIIAVRGRMGSQVVKLLTLDSDKELMETTLLENDIDFSKGEDYFETDYPIKWFSVDDLNYSYLPEGFYETWYDDHNTFIRSKSAHILTLNYTDDGYFHMSWDDLKYCYAFKSDSYYLADDGPGVVYAASNDPDVVLTVYPDDQYRLVIYGSDICDGSYAEEIVIN